MLRIKNIQKVQLPLASNRVTGSVIILVLLAILFARALMMSHIHPMLLLGEKVASVNMIEHSDRNLSALSISQRTDHFDYYLDTRELYIDVMEGKNLYEVTNTPEGYDNIYKLATDYVHYYQQGDIHFRDWYAQQLGATSYDHEEYAYQASYQQQKGLFKTMQLDYELSIIKEINSLPYVASSFSLALLSVILITVLLMFTIRYFVDGSCGMVGRMVIGSLPISLLLATLIPYQLNYRMSVYHAAEFLSPQPYMFIILTYLLSLLVLLAVIQRAQKKGQVAA